MFGTLGTARSLTPVPYHYNQPFARYGGSAGAKVRILTISVRAASTAVTGDTLVAAVWNRHHHTRLAESDMPSEDV